MVIWWKKLQPVWLKLQVTTATKYKYEVQSEYIHLSYFEVPALGKKGQYY